LSQYSRSFDPEDFDNPHTLALLCVPPRATVLDLGVASGEPIAKELQAQSCHVFGVEIDAESAQAASRYCKDVRVADLDDPAALAPWPDPFDVVLALDVLEHLRSPAEALRRAATLLKPDGFMCVSIPNIAHYSVREQLLHGRFEYTDDGLLDRTHLRFFDWPAIVNLFREAGVEMADVYRIQRPLDTETANHLGTELAQALMADVEAETFQYFVIGRLGPTPISRGRGALAHLQDNFVKERSALREAERYVRHLEATTAKLEGEIAERDLLLEKERSELLKAQGHVRHLEDEIAERDVLLEKERSGLRDARDRVRHLQSALAKLEDEKREGIAGLESELADRMNEIWLLQTQLDMVRKDLEVKDSFLKCVPTAQKVPVRVLGYEFPSDVGKTSVLGYRAVDHAVRMIRKLPGWSHISEWAWRNDSHPPGGGSTR